VSISIVIPTSAPPQQTQQLIDSLTPGLDRPEILEVVIVVNGDVIKTIDASQATEAFDHPKIRVVCEPVGSLLAGRHRGVQETSGDIISFLDDDVTVSSTWIETLISAFHDSNLVLAGGPCRPHYETTPPAWMAGLFVDEPGGGTLSPFMSLIDLGEGNIIPVDPNYIWGLNFSVRRQTLLDLGGFHPDLLPASEQMFQGDGETGLTRKISELHLTAGYFPGLAVTHWISNSRMTLDYVQKRAFYEGVCEGYIGLRQRYLESLDDIHVQPTTGRLRHAVSALWAMIRRNVPNVIARRLLQTLITKYRLRGKKYIEHHFARDQEVRAWVLRSDYWEWSHPKAAR